MKYFLHFEENGGFLCQFSVFNSCLKFFLFLNQVGFGCAKLPKHRTTKTNPGSRIEKLQTTILFMLP